MELSLQAFNRFWLDSTRARERTWNEKAICVHEPTRCIITLPTVGFFELPATLQTTTGYGNRAMSKGEPAPPGSDTSYTGHCSSNVYATLWKTKHIINKNNDYHTHIKMYARFVYDLFVLFTENKRQAHYLKSIKQSK